MRSAIAIKKLKKNKSELVSMCLARKQAQKQIETRTLKNALIE